MIKPQSLHNIGQLGTQALLVADILDEREEDLGVDDASGVHEINLQVIHCPQNCGQRLNRIVNDHVPELHALVFCVALLVNNP